MSDARKRGWPPFKERMWRFVSPEPNTGCWLWLGRTARAGYGQVEVNKRLVPSHRATWEALRGPIPGDLVIDHLCRNPSCVNPDHLEPVTERENILRGISPTAMNARKTVCGKCGGPFDKRTSNGFRSCSACEKAYSREYDRKRRHAKGVPSGQ